MLLLNGQLSAAILRSRASHKRTREALKLRRSRKPPEGLQPFSLVPTTLSGRREVARANLAVIGCHSVDAMDVGGQKRSWANVSGQPPAVLKTAFLPSAGVHHCSRKMEIQNSKSADVRQRLQTSNRMAVSLAVSLAVISDVASGRAVPNRLGSMSSSFPATPQVPA